MESKVGEVKDLGVIGHGVQHHRSKILVPKVIKAKGHGLTGHNLEMKGQEFKGEISALKTRGSVSKIINMARNSQGKNERLRSRRFIQVKDYGVKGRSVKGHGSKVGRVEGQWSRRSVR